MTDIFGAIQVTSDLEYAVQQTLQSWFEVYLREIELQSPAAPDTRNIPPNSLPDPKSYLTADQLDAQAGVNLPALVVVSPGLSRGKVPAQEGDGSFRAFFSIAVGIFVAADNRPNTMRLVRLYTAIARTIMLQKQSLGGFADGTDWLDESYDDHFPFVDGSTISAGQVVFDIEVSGVVNRYGGPVTPPDPATQPGSNWPVADTVTPTVSTKE